MAILRQEETMGGTYIQNLRREAERLRKRAGMPLAMSTLETLSAGALRYLIADARGAIKAKAEHAERERALHDLIAE